MDLSRRGRIMGILNTTPDSFSDGGLNNGPGTAMEHARRMISEGAEIIDIGGESTRPGAAEVPEQDEIARTAPIIRALRAEWDGWISIDTSKAAVAEAALTAGADIVNDVCGLRDPAMVAVCAASGCGVVVMHMQGQPRTMQLAPTYGDVVREIRGFFEERHASLTSAGIHPEALCFDPGIGFGKTLDHNLALLRSLGDLAAHNRPLLLGVSRKSFLGVLLGETALEAREWPTAALTSLGREKGVLLHRVHSVRTNLEALRMTEAILGGGQLPPAA
ncbi:dihydropteroate synthase [Luteolibacter sp. SL250]|uniref:dihydropteroate synthase n=1 Tax=Luteolibacter sp. SL250 TaxID=2995170 RepID=UPI00226FBCC1|nr:dihydropteroate synthase [Luteolibacter sp. SL250]WAC20594.1 dihydropteroate synthase [Luteolibacter sp. SL250]